MKSLFDYYSEQSESYYGINYNVEDLFLSDFKTSQSRCENFLHNHYMRGRKKLLDSIFYEQYEKCGKHSCHDLQFSVLQVLSKAMSKEQIIDAETLWKKKLLTYEPFGMNKS